MNTRKTLLALALVSSLFGAASLGAHAAGVTMPSASAAITGGGTPIDWAIDAAVGSRQISSTEQRILREQMQLQFQSLNAAQRQRVLAVAQSATSQEGAMRVTSALASAVQESARTAEAAMRAADSAQGIKPKLGADGDTVFVSTAGPCRVFDSRFGPGPLGAGAARQVWTMSDVPGYSWGGDQGGTGSAGAGNCLGTVFLFGTVSPVSVVATVTVVNTVVSGALQAWNGGTTLSGGAVVNWNAGDRLSNTTVIPMSRFVAPYAGSGGKRDIGLNNNSGAAIDVVIDVVGYFVENRATPLDCTTITGATTNIPANGTVFVNAPACPAGYTTMSSEATLGDGRYLSTLWSGSCRLGNLTGGVLTGSCDAVCCRVPGR